MTQSLFSTSWYRVAELRPRLRSHTQIHRHLYRGEVWYVLQDHASGRFHRFTPEANLVIGLMDGQRTMQAVWELALSRLGNDVPPQDEIIQLLAELHRADVLQTDQPLHVAELHQRRRQHRRMRFKQYLGNPLSLRFPLFDPDRLLNRLRPWAAPLFGWAGALLWLLVVGVGLALAVTHWRTLSAGVLDHVFSAQNLLLIALLYPVVKLLHEIAHGMVVKQAGGEVHEMGVLLLLLMPIPYVDASAASAFRHKRWRMLTGFAGMGVELFIGALALIAWSLLDPGFARAVAYNLVLLTGASTLIFNGNPLLRYDGYYILADGLEIPNLAQRASQYWGWLFRRGVLGMKEAEAPQATPGERAWFVFYGAASLAYRVWITLIIVTMVAARFFFVGVLLAIWALWSMALQPLLMQARKLAAAGGQAESPRRAWGGGLAFAAALLLVAFALPLPSVTVAEGVVWAPERTQVRATVDGFVQQVLARPGQTVRAGQPLIVCDDPELRARQAQAAAQLAELQARADAARVANRLEARILDEQVGHVRATYELATRRIEELVLRAPVDGRFVIQQPDDLPGRLLQRGELVADVLEAAGSVRVVVSQDDEERVRAGTVRVQVRRVERVAEVLPARIVRQVPAATDQLPSLTLSLQGGGRIGLDPNAERGDARSIEKLFLIDLELPAARGGAGPQADPAATRLGSRVFVRFEHRPEPLAQQLWRAGRRLVLRTLHV